jgi:CRISPR-associated protein Cas1
VAQGEADIVQLTDTLYGAVRNGVLTLSGFYCRVSIEHGRLAVIDGLRGEFVETRFSRAYCPISRLIITSHEGMITAAAVRWLDGVGAVVVMLDYDGRPLLASVPRRPAGMARLRRRQAGLSIEAGLGAEIARELIEAKNAGEIALLRDLGMVGAADRASIVADALPAVGTGRNALLGIEGRVSSIFWHAVEDTTIAFARREAVPEHWRVFGARRSVLTGRPRLAVTPANAISNYLNNVALSEIIVAMSAGLDPELGVLHADAHDSRASAAYDLLEPLRPIVARWLLAWLREAVFTKRDFIEGMRGEVRLMRPLPSHLALTAALWREPAAAVVGWFVQRLAGKRSRLRLTPSVEAGRGRYAARWRPGRAIARTIPPLCANCGRALSGRKRKFCGADCIAEYYTARGIATGPAVIASAVARAARKSRSIDPAQ